MNRLAIFIAGMLCLNGIALAGAFPRQGDFFLISRDRDGQFIGSHKLFKSYAEGLKKVAYCNRHYFVRSHSVAWTQMETQRGHTVQIEYNHGRGWRPICAGPERQVTLKDIGIDLRPEELLAQAAVRASPKNRLSGIGSGFGTSYHTP